MNLYECPLFRFVSKKKKKTFEKQYSFHLTAIHYFVLVYHKKIITKYYEVSSCFVEKVEGVLVLLQCIVTNLCERFSQPYSTPNLQPLRPNIFITVCHLSRQALNTGSVNITTRVHIVTSERLLSLKVNGCNSSCKIQ